MPECTEAERDFLDKMHKLMVERADARMDRAEIELRTHRVGDPSGHSVIQAFYKAHQGVK